MQHFDKNGKEINAGIFCDYLFSSPSFSFL